MKKIWEKDGACESFSVNAVFCGSEWILCWQSVRVYKENSPLTFPQFLIGIDHFFVVSNVAR